MRSIFLLDHQNPSKFEGVKATSKFVDYGEIIGEIIGETIGENIVKILVKVL